MTKKKVLVVDDEKHIVELIKLNLESYGYEVICAFTGMEAITKTNEILPDLILLDLMLPDIDGLQICQMLRLNEETKGIPIIMITARSQETDKVHGLEAGADDYITKPFGIRELEARIKTVLRRSDNTSIIDINKTINSKLIKIKDLIINPTIYQVTRNQDKIDLTLTEFKILKLLIENKDKVMTRQSLLYEISDDKSKPDNRTIDVHIRNIRKKLEDGHDLEYIETIRGVGYRMK